MNERLFELIQSHNGLCGLLWTEEDKQEFAELIVRECCDLLETSLPYNPQQKMIKKHFGVE